MWKRVDDSIQRGVYMKTCLMQNGNEYNVQMMKFEKGLWWSSDENYTYYAPTHFWSE